MGFFAGFAPCNGNAFLGVRDGHVSGKVQLKELVSEGAVIRSRGQGPDGEDFERVLSKVQEGQFGLETLRVRCGSRRTGGGTLSDGGGGVDNPRWVFCEGPR